MADLSLLMAAVLAVSAIGSGLSVAKAQWHAAALHRAGEVPATSFSTKKGKP
jgi:hypothetical protein